MSLEEEPPSEAREEPEKKSDPTIGMIGKRVLMPIGMWTEILELSRQGGGGAGDYRDVLLQILDLGLQAQSADRFKPRFVQLDDEVLGLVSRAAQAASLTEESALVRLVDLGLQAKAAELERTRPPGPPTGTRIRIEFENKLLLSTYSRAVPAQDEIVSVNGEPYVVKQRAWSATANGLVAYLRVTPYEPA